MNKLSPAPAGAPILTINEANAEYRTPRAVLRSAMKTGCLPYIKLPNGGVRIRRADIEIYIESLLVKTVDAVAIVDQMVKRTPREARLRAIKQVNA
jgi:hypothetical protein